MLLYKKAFILLLFTWYIFLFSFSIISEMGFLWTAHFCFLVFIRSYNHCPAGLGDHLGLKFIAAMFILRAPYSVNFCSNNLYLGFGFSEHCLLDSEF